jgi:hypothetical protein
MLTITSPWRVIIIGALGVIWFAPVAPLAAAQEADQAEITATVTETSAGMDMGGADMTAPAVTTAPAATDASGDQVTTESVLPPATTNPSIPSPNGLSAATNAPLPDPRAGDAPGWWFEAVLKQRNDYPAFLGVRFAEVSRAVIIETPNRKLTVGQPLFYRLWVCNDLPQSMECRVEHAVRKGEIIISQTNVLHFMVKGSEARLVDRFQQSTAALAPGIYTIDATLRDQSGKLLNHMTEIFELTAAASSQP